MYIVVLDKVQNCLGKCIKKLYFPSLKTNLTILSTVFLKYVIKLKENCKYFKNCKFEWSVSTLYQNSYCDQKEFSIAVFSSANDDENVRCDKLF